MIKYLSWYGRIKGKGKERIVQGRRNLCFVCMCVCVFCFCFVFFNLKEEYVVWEKNYIK